MPVYGVEVPGVALETSGALLSDWTAALHEHRQKHVAFHFSNGKAITSRMLE